MPGRATDPITIPASLWHRPDTTNALSGRDIGLLLRLVRQYTGASQTQIAIACGLTQSKVSEYMKNGGRQVLALDVFERIADGLTMPDPARMAMGLAPRHPHTPSAAPADAPITDQGLGYPDDADTAAVNVVELWRADLDDTHPIAEAPLDHGTWSATSVRWLVSHGLTSNRETTGPRIGLSDVARFRTTVELFAQLDNRFGGGHARQGLIQYLATDGERLLRGVFADDLREPLYSAVAEATLLAAWMTYDSAPTSGLAQRYFVQALALAQAGDNRLLGASILDAMSHQATFVGRFRDAANLAGVARTGTEGIATPTLTAHFYAMEARALARIGDATACATALSNAVTAFERRNPDEDPEWIRYFDDAELAAEFGHCFRDLGRAVDATQYANQCLGAIDDTTFQRSDFFATMVLADAHLGAGEADQACAVTLRALQVGEQLRSARAVSYLKDFRERLTAIGTFTAGTEFDEQARRSRLWRIAARRA